jgi:hypothetical protein
MLHRSRCQCLNFGFDFFSKRKPTNQTLRSDDAQVANPTTLKQNLDKTLESCLSLILFP